MKHAKVRGPGPASGREINGLADEFQTLASVCRLIAGRAGNPAVRDELRELAEGLDEKIERLRAAARPLL
jgi:hypothetical protein